MMTREERLIIREERRAEAVSNLLTAAAEGTPVYNVDFKAWKELAGSAYETVNQTKVREPFFNNGRWEARTEIERDIDDAISYSLSQFPSKKLLKLVETAGDTFMVDAVKELIAEWKPVRDAIKAIKPNVVMGRKPSTDPRKTPERTLDNTGTCAVCEMNVKLDKGQHIVAHGYTIQWGFQSGNCHGVGFKPIELSSEGAISWKGVLEASLAHAEENLQSFRDSYEVDKNRTTRIAVSQAEATIRFAPRDIEMFEKRIATWEAKPLPDAKK